MLTWLDCDPGHDDAMALILCVQSPQIQLVGVSTVHGNQSLEKVTVNAARVLCAAGAEGVPVYPGQAAPLLREAKHDPEIHGESGLCGTDKLPSMEQLEDGAINGGQKAVVAMAEAIMHLPQGELMHIVATGALTNVALLLTLFPELKPKIACVAFMGGALGVGNRGPVAEFNIQNDPEAAQIVCCSGCKVVMVPLEVTHTALATPDVLQRISGLNSRFGELIMELLLFFKDTYKRVFDFDSPPVHDPCAVAYLLDPDMFVCQLMRVDVECSSSLSLGQTVCDVWGDSDKPSNVHVAKKIDVPKFWNYMITALEEANKCTPVNNKKAKHGEQED